MTDHPTNPEPLDPQERELARILRALPAGEPSPAMDARILRAAGDAAAASQGRPRSRWLVPTGAIWGIGGAAAAVLALGVGLQTIIPEPRIAPREPVATAVSDRADDAALSVGFQERKPETYNTTPPPPAPAIAQAPKPAASSRARTAQADGFAAPAAPAPASAPEAFADQTLDEHVALAPESAAEIEVTGAVAGAAAPALERDASRDAAANVAQAARAQSSRQEEAAGAAAKQAMDSAKAAAAPPGPMKPATWLAHVRRLRDANQPEAARTSLQAFRKRYPHFVVPDDLAPLLRE